MIRLDGKWSAKQINPEGLCTEFDGQALLLIRVSVCETGGEFFSWQLSHLQWCPAMQAGVLSPMASLPGYIKLGKVIAGTHSGMKANTMLVLY